jgi:hypothetical protein
LQLGEFSVYRRGKFVDRFQVRIDGIVVLFSGRYGKGKQGKNDGCGISFHNMSLMR